MVYSNYASVDFATIGEDVQRAFVVGCIGVQYAKGWSLCQVKSDTSSRNLDNIHTVRVQFSREAIGYKKE